MTENPVVRLLNKAGIHRPGSVRELREELYALRAERKQYEGELSKERRRHEKVLADERRKHEKLLMDERRRHERETLRGVDGVALPSAAEELRALRARLRQIEQSTLQAREEMMVIEVKLDIVEGAITVLDDRSRAAVAERAAAAPVARAYPPASLPAPGETTQNNLVDVPR